MGTHGSYWLVGQMPSKLFKSLICLLAVTALTSGNNILPDVLASTTGGQNMVDSVSSLGAIYTTVLVSGHDVLLGQA
jgi:hypothetical protein